MLPSMTVLLTLVSLTCGENPAIQVILKNKGLQYGKEVGAGWIQEKLELITLPDISGVIKLGFLGKVYYTLTGITITKCDFPEPTVEFYQDATGFKTSSLGLSVHGCDLYVNLGKDPDGRLSVTSISCDARVGEVDIRFHGGASHYFPFVDHFKGRIKSDIEGKICPTVEESILNVESHLQAMNVSFDVNQDLTIDLPLTGLPVIDASSLNLGLKGEFYSIKSPAEPPFEAQAFTIPEQQGYMLSMGLSEFTLNSASYGYFSAGLLKALINDSMIPPSSPVRLNTSSIGQFIPQLPKMFPDLLMSLQVYAREIPLFSFLPGAVKLGFQGAVKAFAIQANKTQTPLFKLNVDTQLSGKVWIASGKLKGSLKMDNFTLTLAASEVGPFKVQYTNQSYFKRSWTTICVFTNFKKSNILGKGVEIPRMRQAQLVNTVLQMEEGFIAIFSDAQVLLTLGGFN
uniref:Bactericidal permeability-increasing protein n=1 Tax=Labrus bergylta TaxID=56723 RepID=A0A3Q3EMA6_9LABR